MRISSRARIATATTLTAMAGLAATVLPAGPAAAASASTPIGGGGYSQFQNDNSGLCLGISAEGTAGQWTCTGADNQAWKSVAYGDGYYLENASGQCLYAESTADGTQVYAGTGEYCTQDTDDWVTWIYNANGTITPRTDSSAVVGVAGGSSAQGAHVVMWNPGGNIAFNQQWSLEAPS